MGSNMIHIHPHAINTVDTMVLMHNVLAQGTLSWSSQTFDGFAANALGPQTYDFWTPQELPATLSVTLPQPVTCDACAIVGHTLGTVSATATVEYWDGAGWAVAHTVSPTNDRDLLMIFPQATSGQWRVRITGATVPSISVVMIGPRFLIPYGVQAGYVPLNLALDIELSPSVTVKGQYVGTFVKKMGTGATIALAQQEMEWIETTATGFIEHYNAGRPFVFASCPQQRVKDLAYCWRSGRNSLTASYGAGAMWGEMSMEVQGYVG